MELNQTEDSEVRPCLVRTSWDHSMGPAIGLFEQKWITKGFTRIVGSSDWLTLVLQTRAIRIKQYNPLANPSRQQVVNEFFGLPKFD